MIILLFYLATPLFNYLRCFKQIWTAVSPFSFWSYSETLSNFNSTPIVDRYPFLAAKCNGPFPSLSFTQHAPFCIRKDDISDMSLSFVTEPYSRIPPNVNNDDNMELSTESILFKECSDSIKNLKKSNPPSKAKGFKGKTYWKFQNTIIYVSCLKCSSAMQNKNIYIN